MIQLEWSTVQRRVNDLLPWEKNPRKITEAKKQKMIESLQKFNLVDLPVCDIDNTLISGHQRLKAMQFLGRGEEIVDVRYPNRKLTDKEIKEYSLLANSHFGEFDFEMLNTDFADINFGKIGLDISLPAFDFEEKPAAKKPEVRELKPFEQTHVLISFPPERMIDLQELLEKIKQFEFVEYDQSSN
jgi:hypothetical protein